MCWLPCHTPETQEGFAFHSGPLAAARLAHRTHKLSLSCSPTIGALQVDPVISFLSFIYSFNIFLGTYSTYGSHSYCRTKGGFALDLTLKGCMEEGTLEASLEGRVEFGQEKLVGPVRESMEAGNVCRWNWTYFLGQEHRVWANHRERRKGRVQESCIIITNDK